VPDGDPAEWPAAAGPVPADPGAAGDPGDSPEWPAAAAVPVTAREAVEQGMPGWPRPGEAPAPPTRPVPAGRGGAQRIPRPFNARPGKPAPWGDLPAERRRPDVAQVRAGLAALGPPQPSVREL